MSRVIWTRNRTIYGSRGSEQQLLRLIKTSQLELESCIPVLLTSLKLVAFAGFWKRLKVKISNQLSTKLRGQLHLLIRALRSAIA